jgi:hypothetical protein
LFVPGFAAGGTSNSLHQFTVRHSFRVGHSRKVRRPNGLLVPETAMVACRERRVLQVGRKVIVAKVVRKARKALFRTAASGLLYGGSKIVIERCSRRFPAVVLK